MLYNLRSWEMVFKQTKVSKGIQIVWEIIKKWPKKLENE
jgi:hypothetical protein